MTAEKMAKLVRAEAEAVQTLLQLEAELSQVRRYSVKLQLAVEPAESTEKQVSPL